MNKKILIIFAVFALIISCKNYATGKDIKQNAKGKIKGFLDKVLDPAKDKITSNGPKVDEVAKKLQEEELMQGDDPNNSQLSPPLVLLASGQDNALVLKAEQQQSGGQQEEQAKARKEDKGKGEKAEDRKEKQEDKEGSDKEKEEIEEQNKGQKQEAEKEAKEKQEREEKQKRQQEEQQRKAKEEAEKEAKEKQEEEKKVKDKIKNLVDKIAKINGDIDGIKGKTSVGAEEVRDKITGPVYDDFTDDSSKAIYYTWNLENEEDSELEKLLKELSDARSSLRTRLNEGNKPLVYTIRKEDEPKLKEIVNVSEIKSDLEKLKSKLEDVKKYLEDNSKFEEIKGYITDNSDYYDED
ncbi:ErpC protein [Borreliella burgdorferi]|uniref:ErpC protein n=1 Tax=Borreliella burgdorferi TaxID=139 RepID=UPI002709E495|nr:ErpC protein [Borreliella burgdorferi]MDO7273068.1 ErpC protein [Borreliella burgdorferi]